MFTQREQAMYLERAENRISKLTHRLARLRAEMVDVQVRLASARQTLFELQALFEQG